MQVGRYGTFTLILVSYTGRGKRSVDMTTREFEGEPRLLSYYVVPKLLLAYLLVDRVIGVPSRSFLCQKYFDNSHVGTE